ncbi:MAG: transposase [Candidatus Kapaibacterium sp.]
MGNYSYTEEFKRELVKDIESGKYRSVDEAKKLLQIGGSMTIYKWMAKYGKNVKLADTKRVSIILDERMMKNSRDDKVKVLEKQLEEMRQAKHNTEIELEFYKAVVDIVKEDYDIDLKKKYGLKQLKK